METSSLTFAQPWWLLGILAAPVFAILYIWSQRRGDALISRLVAPRLKAELANGVSLGLRIFRAVLVLAAVILMSIALARPQMGYIENEIKHRGRDIIIAVDTSRSMLATDVPPTRLARAKLLAQDLMRFAAGDRIGLVAFAGSSFLQAPLTLDQSAVLQALDELDTSVIPKGGTNIAAAIRTADEAFGKGEGNTRALVILTDGEELDADGIAAAKNAAEQGVRVFTVGIGSSEGSLIPIRADGGGSDFVRDQAGKPVQTRLDENRLKEIASAGGGFYQPLGPDAAKAIFEKGILPLEEKESTTATSRQPIERYQWPLGFALGFVVLWLIVGDKRRTARVSRPALALLAIVLLAPSARADALGDYQAGNYDKAMQEFSERLKSSPDSVKLQYNAGAAAYKTGDYGKAVEHFTKAILAEDNKLREEALYNLGNSLVRRGEVAKGNEEKKADWKNAIQHYTEALKVDPKDKQAEENRDIVKKLLEDLEKQEKQKQDEQKKDQQKQDQKDKKDQNKDQQQQQNQQQKDQNKDQQQQKDQQNQQQQQQQNQDQKKDDKQEQKPDQQKQQGQGQNSQDQKKDQDQNGKSGDQDKKDQQGGDKKDQQQDQQSKGDQKQDEQKKDQQKDQQSQSGDKGQEQKDQPQPQQGQNPDQGGQQDQKQDQNQPAPQPTPGDKKQGELKSAGDQKDQGQPQGQEAQGAAAGEGEEKDGEMSAAQARSLLNSLRSDEERVKLMQRQQTEDTVKDW